MGPGKRSPPQIQRDPASQKELVEYVGAPMPQWASRFCSSLGIPSEASQPLSPRLSGWSPKPHTYQSAPSSPLVALLHAQPRLKREMDVPVVSPLALPRAVRHKQEPASPCLQTGQSLLAKEQVPTDPLSRYQLQVAELPRLERATFQLNAWSQLLASANKAAAGQAWELLVVEMFHHALASLPPSWRRNCDTFLAQFAWCNKPSASQLARDGFLRVLIRFSEEVIRIIRQHSPTALGQSPAQLRSQLPPLLPSELPSLLPSLLPAWQFLPASAMPKADPVLTADPMPKVRFMLATGTSHHHPVEGR